MMQYNTDVHGTRRPVCALIPRRWTALAAAWIAATGASAQTTYRWVAPVSGLWSDTGAWSPTGSPGQLSPLDIALLDEPGAYLISVDLDVAIDTLTIAQPLAGVLVPAGSTLDVRSLLNAGQLTIDAGVNTPAALRLGDGATLNGRVTFSGDPLASEIRGPASGAAAIAPTVALGGSGVFRGNFLLPDGLLLPALQRTQLDGEFAHGGFTIVGGRFVHNGSIRDVEVTATQDAELSGTGTYTNTTLLITDGAQLSGPVNATDPIQITAADATLRDIALTEAATVTLTQGSALTGTGTLPPGTTIAVDSTSRFEGLYPLEVLTIALEPGALFAPETTIQNVTFTDRLPLLAEMDYQLGVGNTYPAAGLDIGSPTATGRVRAFVTDQEVLDADVRLNGASADLAELHGMNFAPSSSLGPATTVSGTGSLTRMGTAGLIHVGPGEHIDLEGVVMLDDARTVVEDGGFRSGLSIFGVAELMPGARARGTFDRGTLIGHPGAVADFINSRGGLVLGEFTVPASSWMTLTSVGTTDNDDAGATITLVVGTREDPTLLRIAGVEVLTAQIVPIGDDPAGIQITQVDGASATEFATSVLGACTVRMPLSSGSIYADAGGTVVIDTLASGGISPMAQTETGVVGALAAGRIDFNRSGVRGGTVDLGPDAAMIGPALLADAAIQSETIAYSEGDFTLVNTTLASGTIAIDDRDEWAVEGFTVATGATLVFGNRVDRFVPSSVTVLGTSEFAGTVVLAGLNPGLAVLSVDPDTTEPGAFTPTSVLTGTGLVDSRFRFEGLIDLDRPEDRLVITGDTPAVSTGDIRVLNGARLTLIASLGGGGTLTTDAAGRVVTPGPSAISDTTLQGELVVDETGPLTLGTGNTHLGPISVGRPGLPRPATLTLADGVGLDAEVVLISDALASAQLSGPGGELESATIDRAARISGNGILQGAITDIRGALNPGATDQPGVLECSFTRPATLHGTAVLDLAIRSAQPDGSARLLVSGDLALGGTLRLRIDPGLALAPADTFAIIADAPGTAGAALTGRFAAIELVGELPGELEPVVYYEAGRTLLAFTCPVDLALPAGTIDIFDVVAFLQRWNSAQPDADFDENGAVNILDVVAFVTAWSDGCNP